MKTAERESAGSKTVMEVVNSSREERANGEPHFLLKRILLLTEEMGPRVRREGRRRKGRKAAAALILIFCQRD